MKPIFLFTLPRSGSTLLQRVLTAHDDISSTSEPWMLLPLFYTRKEAGVFAEYNHDSSQKALKDFLTTMPDGDKAYQSAIRAFAKTLYSESAREETKYFLDKTPRYHLIAEDIIQAFPDAKFIFLWRNPLSIVSSLINSWGNGNWNLFRYKIDLFSGIDNLLQAQRKYQDISYSLNYETLTTSKEELKSLFNYLELDYDSELLQKFKNVSFEGRMGDKSAKQDLGKINLVSNQDWQHSLNSSFRKNWATNYLNRLNADDLTRIGYSKDNLLVELKGLSNDNLAGNIQRDLKDRLAHCYGIGYQLTEPMMFKSKLKHIVKRQGTKLHAHR